MREWIRRNKAYLLIGVLLVVARGVQVVILLYYDDMRDFIASLFGFFSS